MASACVNNIGVPPENFPAAPHSSFSWLSPRISFSREESKMAKTSNPPEKKPDLEVSAGEFEFRLDDPAVMLPADELFSDGKLMPLQLKTTPENPTEGVRSPERVKFGRRSDGDLSFTKDSYLFSPKAPRCSSRWRELLGLKKQNNNKQETQTPKTTSSSSSSSSSSSTSTSTSTSTHTKSIRLFLYRNTKTTSSDSSLSLPLLNPSDCDSLSRISTSSSDLPRHSLDSSSSNPTRPRPARSPVRRPDPTKMVRERGVSVDSPRLNSSGRVLFQSLERSSSSPSSFNGGRPRYNYRGGMERSYSANVAAVRVTPVLNVPVCSSLRGSSKFGFGQLFSSATSATNSHKKDNNFTNKNKKESS